MKNLISAMTLIGVNTVYQIQVYMNEILHTPSSTKSGSEFGSSSSSTSFSSFDSIVKKPVPTCKQDVQCTMSILIITVTR